MEAVSPRSSSPVTPPASAEQAIVRDMQAGAIAKHIRELAAAPRVTGTPAFRQAAEYVAETARKNGWDVTIEPTRPFGRPDQPPRPGELQLYNVIARRAGTAPDGQRKLVIAGAHLDSVRNSPGGNDNASGSAALLELTRVMGQHPTPNDIEVIWFDGEERGLLGSAAFVRAHRNELQRAVAMLNADMIGSPNGATKVSLAPGAPNSVMDAVRGAAERNSIPFELLSERHGRSDHASFDRAGVPSLTFGPSARRVSSEDPAYHSPRDTADNINPKVLEGMADLLALSVNAYAHAKDRPAGARPPRQLTPHWPPAAGCNALP